MRVAVVVSHVIQYFCPQYVSWAALPGVDLKVLFGSRDGLEEYFDAQFNKVVRWQGLDLSFPHEFLSGTDGSTTIATTSLLEDALDKFGAEAVLVYGYDQPIIRQAIRWARRSNAYILMLADVEMRSERPWLKSIAKSLILPPILRPVDVFLTVGDACEDYYRHYGVPDTKLVRCPFPIDRTVFDRKLAVAARTKSDLRDKLRIPNNHKIVLNVGKLVPRKRPQDLVEFSNQFQGERDDITVVHVGAGQGEAELRSKCEKQGPGGLVFSGFVQPADLVDYIIASDAYLLTSSIEPHSLAVSEAIYAGLPVVVSDRCGSYGPTDDVRPGVNGFVFPCGDIDRMSELLLHVLDTPALYKRFASASRAIGVENQSLAHGAGLLHAVDLLQSGSATTGRSVRRLEKVATH